MLEFDSLKIRICLLIFSNNARSSRARLAGEIALKSPQILNCNFSPFQKSTFAVGFLITFQDDHSYFGLFSSLFLFSAPRF